MLLDAATATTTGSAVRPTNVNRTFHATVTGTGAVTATVIIEASNNTRDFLTLGTITLSGTTSAADGFVSVAAWKCVRARLTAISGTDAAVSVQMGA